MTEPCDCCVLGAGRKCRSYGRLAAYHGRRGDVWRRNLSNRPLATSAPKGPTSIEDEQICLEPLEAFRKNTPKLPNADVDNTPSVWSEGLPLYSKALPLSNDVELFKLRSTRESDSDDEDFIKGLDAEDRADSLNSLLVLEERQEGIRRYRSAVDDADRLAHSQATSTREEVTLNLGDEEPSNDNVDAQGSLYESEKKPKLKLPFIPHWLLCFLVTATVGLGLTAVYRSNHSGGGNFLATQTYPSWQPGSPKEQGVDQRPGSLRLENLQMRNRLSNF